MLKKLFYFFRNFVLNLKLKRKLKKYGIDSVDLKRSVRSTFTLEHLKRDDLSFNDYIKEVF